MERTQNEHVGLSLEVETDPVDFVVLDEVEFFKEDGRDVGEVAHQVGFKLDNALHHRVRFLPEFGEWHVVFGQDGSK